MIQRRGRNRSSERVTTPSVEFSTGTTPKSAAPALVAWNTSSAGAGHADDRGAEVAERGLLAERAGRAEVGDARRRLQRAAGRHDLAPDRRHALVLSGPGVACLQAVDDLRPRARGETPASLRALELADALREPARRLSSAEQLAVERVDLRAQRGRSGPRRTRSKPCGRALRRPYLPGAARRRRRGPGRRRTGAAEPRRRRQAEDSRGPGRRAPGPSDRPRLIDSASTFCTKALRGPGRAAGISCSPATRASRAAASARLR